MKSKSMKKNNSSRTKQLINAILNVRYWIDWDRMKDYSAYLGQGIKNMLVPQQKKATESFDEAQQRLNLSEVDLLNKQQSLWRLSLLMLVTAAILLGYAVYQLLLIHLVAFIISLVVTMIALVLAFRYHFWYFQIKRRTLGCSINQWFNEGLKGGKPWIK